MDRNAFAAYYLNYARNFANMVARRRGGCPMHYHDIQDLISDCCLNLVRLMNAAPVFDDDSHCKRYIAKTFRNAYGDWIRTRQKEHERFNFVNELDTFEASYTHQFSDDLDELIERLPAREAETMRLTRAGHTQAEIGASLGVTKQRACQIQQSAERRMRAYARPHPVA